MMLLLSQGVYAQTKEGNNWYFGNSGRMTWNTVQTIVDNGKTLTGLPTPITTPSAMGSQHEGVFCMSDKDGNLLFYSNGMTIWNRNNMVMSNGTDMFGHESSAQSGIVIPYPEQDGKYIAFSASMNINSSFPPGPGNRVAYSIIDMSLADGLGAVTTEKNILLTGHKGVLGESISAVRHSNGVDFWFVAVGKGAGANSCLNVWKVTSAGVDPVCVGSYPLNTNTNPEAPANGYLRFSVDGKYFAWGEHMSLEFANPRLHFGEFNPSNGTFPTIKDMDNGHPIYGVEFSPSTELLYMSGYDANVHIYKFAELLAAPNPPTGVGYRAMIAANDYVGALQLGPDGRIYTSIGTVIDDPDNFSGATSHFVGHLIMSGYGAMGLPNFLPHIFTPTPKAGGIGNNQNVCHNTQPALLTSIMDAECGDETITYLWQRSTDGLSWSTALGTNNLKTYQPPILTASIFYRRSATSTSCGTVYSDPVRMTVAPALSAGTISNSTTSIVSGTAPNAFSSTSASGGNGAITYQWQSAPDDSSWTNIAGATGQSYTPGVLTTTTYYRRVATNSCGIVYTASVRITVTPISKAGVIGANQEICYNTLPSQLTSIADAECGTETITYLWQSSTDSLSWSNATGTNNSKTYQPSMLTATTYYRRNATSSSCGTVHSNVVKITVAAVLSAGTISNTSTSIASGTAPNAFTSTPATGGRGTTTYQWQSSPNGTSTSWTNIAGATSATYAPGTLNATTYYRRAAINNCGTVYTASVLITVTGAADMITVTGSNDTGICNGDPATLNATASGVTGPVFRWYAAATGGSALHTGATFTPSPSPTATTTYYVSVSGTSQSESPRKAVTVTVRPRSSSSMIKVQ